MRKDIRKLLADKALLRQEAKAILDRSEADGRDLTDVESNEFNGIETKLAKLDVQIAELNEESERERTMPAVSTHSGNGDLLGGDELRVRPVRGGRHFAEMFPGALNNGGFRNENEFLKIIHHGLSDPRILATAGMSEGIGQDGGFLVPTEFAARWLDRSLENEIVRPRARIEPMESNSKIVAGWDTETHSSHIGGFVGEWLKEGDLMGTQKGKLRQLTLKVNKLGIYTPVSNELLADGVTFEAQLGAAIIGALGWYLDYAFLNGNGAGQPRGVLSDPALISVAKETGQAAGTIMYENLTKMYARVHPACVGNSAWVVNNTAIPQLLNLSVKIKNVAGTENVGGSHIPVLKEDGQGGFTMLTRPVIFTEKLPTLGNQGDIMLCDFSQYIVGMRKEVEIAKSTHAGFPTDETGYRGIIRPDGMGSWSRAVTPKNGDTLSWAVTLDVRA